MVGFEPSGTLFFGNAPVALGPLFRLLLGLGLALGAVADDVVEKVLDVAREDLELMLDPRRDALFLWGSLAVELRRLALPGGFSLGRCRYRGGHRSGRCLDGTSGLGHAQS